MNLQEKLNQLFGAQIEDFNFNLLEHKLSLTVTLIENGYKENFFLQFVKISSLLLNDENAEKFNNYLWEKAEISSFYYLNPEDISIEIQSKMQQNFNSPIKYNIFFELWECTFFIKAEQLKLNDEIFTL